MVSTTLPPISKLFMRVKSTHLAHWCTWWSFGGSKFKTCWEPERDWACLFHGNTPKDRNPIYRLPSMQFWGQTATFVMFDCIDAHWSPVTSSRCWSKVKISKLAWCPMSHHLSVWSLPFCGILFPFSIKFTKRQHSPQTKANWRYWILAWWDLCFFFFDLSSKVNHPHRPLLYRYIQ